MKLSMQDKRTRIKWHSINKLSKQTLVFLDDKNTPSHNKQVNIHALELLKIIVEELDSYQKI